MLQVTELEQQVHVDRPQCRARVEMPMQFRHPLPAPGRRRGVVVEGLLHVGKSRGRRQREVEHPGAPRPEIRSAGRHRMHVARANPCQQGAPAARGQRFPAVVQPLQQIVQSSRPPFQAAELYRTLVRVIAQPFEQLLGADAGVAIYDHAQPRPCQSRQKGSRSIAVGAIGIGQEAEGKRPPVFQQPAKPQQRAGVFRTERPRGGGFTHRNR